MKNWSESCKNMHQPMAPIHIMVIANGHRISQWSLIVAWPREGRWLVRWRKNQSTTPIGDKNQILCARISVGTPNQLMRTSRLTISSNSTRCTFEWLHQFIWWAERKVRGSVVDRRLCWGKYFATSPSLHFGLPKRSGRRCASVFRGHMAEKVSTKAIVEDVATFSWWQNGLVGQRGRIFRRQH